MTEKTIGTGKVVRKVEGQWQVHCTDGAEVSVYYVSPEDAEGACGIEQEVVLFQREKDGPLCCRPAGEDDEED